MTKGEKTRGCCNVANEPAASHDAAFLASALAVPHAPEATRRRFRDLLREIPGGVFEMGARKSTFAADLDSPRCRVKLKPFLMSATAVTNADYAAFVAGSGYRTVAEREGWSYVFDLLLKDPSRHPTSPPGLPWWRKVDGACWSAPEGPGSDVAARPDHPAVHIAWYDALAYCIWAGLNLPTEAQWERAGRGGLARRKFPWGNEMKPGGAFAMNTFQGDFPKRNTGEDGWIGTAPVDAFSPNGYGLLNMTGNVWEWVADRFGPLPAAGLLPTEEPTGASDGHARVQRGGSYLCHVSYCDRYHVHSRTRNDPDTSAGNMGFRIAASS